MTQNELPALDAPDDEVLSFMKIRLSQMLGFIASIRYRRWHDQFVSDRVVAVLSEPYWGRTDWHPRYQWMISLRDYRNGETREFAVNGILRAERLCEMQIHLPPPEAQTSLALLDKPVRRWGFMHGDTFVAVSRVACENAGLGPPPFTIEAKTQFTKAEARQIIEEPQNDDANSAPE